MLCLTALAGWGCGAKTGSAGGQTPPIQAPTPVRTPPPETVSEPQTRAELPAPQPVPEGAAPAVRGPLAEPPPAAPVAAAEAEPPPARPSSPTPVSPPAESVQTPETPVVPQLGVIRSDAERRRLESAIDEDIRRTNLILSRVQSENLDADQKAAYRRIRQFLAQVEENRAQDAALARNLAARARVLAEDLGRNFR